MAYRLSRQLSALPLALAIFFSLAPAGFCAEKIRVEGIMHDATDSRRSVAILNGTMVKEGDIFGPYKILSITAQAVLGVHEKTGKPVRWLPAAKASESPSSLKMKPSKKETVHREKTNPESKADLPQAKPSFSWNPLELLASAGEMEAISDMHQIYRAVLIYHENQEGGETLAAPDLTKLIEKNLLSRDFTGGTKGKYRFTLTTSRSGFEVNGDPLDSAARLSHFYIGQDGVLRAEKGARAHAQSPAHEY